jgi:acyl-CoA synthetase (AMP-forming)/AMP-acid ligase II
LGAYEFGVPDPLAGENIKAYKYPRSLEFQREILKGAAGKILPRVLREEEMKKRR